MASDTQPDGSEDVNDFLVRIRELGNKRDREDEERTRKIEEEILQGRRERQARRAERARSISPTKDSPPPFSDTQGAQPTLASPTSSQLIDPPLNLAPSTNTAGAETHGMEVTEIVKPKEMAQRESQFSSTNASPTRTPSLSWNRRPASRGTDTRGLAPSALPADAGNTGPRSESISTPTQEPVLSRDQIAQSLGSKDPSWFRQTSDRGIGSPALRRQQEDSVSETSSMNGNVKLPGFSRESTVESQNTPRYDYGSERSRSPSRTSSTFGTSSFGNRYSSVSSVSTTGGLGSPVPLSSSQRLHSRGPSTTSDAPPADRVAMSPTQSRLGNERPSSPTKGLGGFVQSAMMKRSDSVTKRWSGSPAVGRGATFRNDIGTAPKLVHQTSSSISHEGSQGGSASNSRPGSSHSEATVVKHPLEVEQPASLVTSKSDMTSDRFVKPARPQPLSRSDSVSTAGGRQMDAPPSPSKTMDPKRWSPTKASWLESALNKPESPKPKPQTPQEPEWKRDLNRLRRSKQSVDLGKSTPGSGSMPESQVRSRDTSQSSTDKPTKTEPSDQIETGSVETAPKTLSETRLQAPPKPVKSDILKDMSPSSPDSPSDGTAKPSSETPLTKTAPATKSQADLLSPKPKTPGSPAHDFRSNLRRRDTGSDSPNTDAPEFMNVFGKLKKTETKNYKAPDEFKDNILRGKAALNITGGPQKTKRVDEFKESLTQQKEAMKAGGGSIRRNANEPVEKVASPVPEAIARRGNLGRSDSVASRDKSLPSLQKTGTLPLRTQRSDSQQSLDQKESPRESRPTSATRSSNDSQRSPPEEKSPPVLETVPAQPQPLSDISNKRDLSEDKSASNAVSPSDTTTVKSPPLNERAAKGTLAGRLNPALAGILSRGPPSSDGSSSGPGEPLRIKSSSQEPKEPATLTHMTKSRARGPKRRAPGNAAKSEAPAGQERNKENAKPAINTFSSPNSFAKSEQQIPSEILSMRVGTRTPTSNAPKTYGQLDPPTPSSTSRLNTKPPVSTKSPQLRKLSNIGERSGEDEPEPIRVTPTESDGPFLPSTRYGEPVTESLKRPTMTRSSASDDQKPTQKPSIPHKSASFPSPTGDKPQRTVSPQLPVKPRNLSGTGPPPGPATDSKSPLTKEPQSMEPEQTPQRRRLPSPPTKPESPSIPPKPKSTGRPASQAAFPFPESSDAAQLFSNFFAAPPKASDKVEVDPQSILMSTAGESPKVKTISKQIWELTGDGKKLDLPPSQEYILFEESMYLCVHVFEGSNGKTTQVHLWSGDGVGEAALEDAQLFARKVARENSCKLELLKQGKETAYFIQALGGIIITRRGRSNASASTYMLCGRRHMGQIAFDEVDLSARRLCSGYPYIVSAKPGKLYLWQGRGSAADELGCARLIAMDLGGEMEEIQEGEEPAGFFDEFPDKGASYHAAEYWRLKPSKEQYRCRLFRVDHEQRFGSGFWNRRGGSPNNIVQEIVPFCQRDLEPGHIYVLDGFFEIFVIVGERSSSRSADFASALVFAQEYGILAVSVQDRPFLPKSNVVLDGLPVECVSAFRKWEERRDEKTPRVLPLNAAIEAIRQ